VQLQSLGLGALFAGPAKATKLAGGRRRRSESETDEILGGDVAQPARGGHEKGARADFRQLLDIHAANVL